MAFQRGQSRLIRVGTLVLTGSFLAVLHGSAAPEGQAEGAVREITRESRIFTGHTGQVTCVAFAPDGHTALSTSTDKTIRLWDVENGRELRAFKGHVVHVMQAAFSPDARTVLSCSGHMDEPDRSALILWDATTLKELRRFQGHTQPVFCLAFSRDGRQILSGGADQTVRLWDAGTGKQLRCMKVEGHTEGALTVAFSPDGKSALAGYADRDWTTRLWDLATGKELHEYVGQRGEKVAFFALGG